MPNLSIRPGGAFGPLPFGTAHGVGSAAAVQSAGPWPWSSVMQFKDLGLDIRARRPFSRYFAGVPKQAFSAVYAFTLNAAEPILRSCLLLVGGVYHAAVSAKPDGVRAVIVQFDLNSRTQS